MSDYTKKTEHRTIKKECGNMDECGKTIYISTRHPYIHKWRNAGEDYDSYSVFCSEECMYKAMGVKGLCSSE